MKKETTNITALRSKTWITESLLKLMEEKDFSKITITEIIKNADLTRQTFYRNFDSKEDILYEYVNKLFESCFNEIEKIPEKNMRMILITYFQYWHKNKDFLLLMTKNKLIHKTMDFYYPYMNKHFNQSIIKFSGNSNSEIDYMKYFLLGGLIQVKTRWLENGFLETPTELADLVLNSINPSVYNVTDNSSPNS